MAEISAENRFYIREFNQAGDTSHPIISEIEILAQSKKEALEILKAVEGKS